MRSRTPKRAKQEIEYKKICDEIDREAKEISRYVCFFCGKPIRGDAIHHHLDGREEGLLTDKENIILCHPACHVAYHDLPVRKQVWREVFLEHLREKNLRLYFKEREKENK
jgi:5-methylcytosine-specific restriction endonuclease McrA